MGFSVSTAILSLLSPKDQVSMHLKIYDQKSSVNQLPRYTSSLSIQRAWHSRRNIGTWLRFVGRATRTTITRDIYEVFEQLKRYRRSRHGRMPLSCNSTMVFPTLRRNCCRRARCFTKGRGRGKKKRKARGVRVLPGNRGRQETHCWVVSAIFKDGGHRCCRQTMEESDTWSRCEGGRWMTGRTVL